MRIAVTGASGLIGSALVTRAHESGHDVVRLVRRTPQAQDEARWDPEQGQVDLSALEGLDGVIHLAGAGVGDHRWTPEYKSVIRDSRVLGTRTLVDALGRLDAPPPVLVSGSAIGFYGDRGDEELTEESAPGEGFLADVVREWEAEAGKARACGIRVPVARTGLVMAPRGGAFARLLPLIGLGLGGPLGSGRQWWSWITLVDEVNALLHLLEAEVDGPVNLTAPTPERNRAVVRALAAQRHRPALLPAPAIALRLLLGDFAEDVLSGQRVLPTVLEASGFTFAHRTLSDAAAWVMGQAETGPAAAS